MLPANPIEPVEYDRLVAICAQPIIQKTESYRRFALQLLNTSLKVFQLMQDPHPSFIGRDQNIYRKTCATLKKLCHGIYISTVL